MNASDPARRGAAVLSRDTSLEAEQRQVALWRGMTPLEKAGLVSSASRAAQLLSLAGIRPELRVMSGVSLFGKLRVGFRKSIQVDGISGDPPRPVEAQPVRARPQR